MKKDARANKTDQPSHHQNPDFQQIPLILERCSDHIRQRPNIEWTRLCSLGDETTMYSIFIFPFP